MIRQYHTTIRRWAVVGAAGFAIVAGSFLSLRSLRNRGQVRAAAHEGALARALLFVGRMAKCGDSRTPPSIPTRGGGFMIQSVHSRRP